MQYNFDEIVARRGSNSLKYDALLERFGATDILPLWVADMDFKIPDFISEAFTDIVSHGIYGYHIKTEKYFSSIAHWFASRHSYNIDNESIIFTPGVVPALSYLVHAFTEKGDTIIVQPPVYYPFFSVVTQNGRQLAYNQLIEKDNYYTIDFDLLERQARDAKMFIFCSPHNPASRVWTPSELLKVADICLRNNVLLISDEIHNDLVFAPNKHVPTGSLSPEIDKITITCHSASKTFNLAGLSTAHIIIKDEILRKQFKNYYANLHADALNIFGLESQQLAFTHGEAWLAQLMQYLKQNHEFLLTFLQQHIPQITCTPLEATYLVWLNFKAFDMDDNALRKFIIADAKLALNNGPIFGPGGSGFQRINIACPRSTLTEGLLRLKNAVDNRR